MTQQNPLLGSLRPTVVALIAVLLALVGASCGGSGSGEDQGAGNGAPAHEDSGADPTANADDTTIDHLRHDVASAIENVPVAQRVATRCLRLVQRGADAFEVRLCKIDINGQSGFQNVTRGIAGEASTVRADVSPPCRAALDVAVKIGERQQALLTRIENTAQAAKLAMLVKQNGAMTTKHIGALGRVQDACAP